MAVAAQFGEKPAADSATVLRQLGLLQLDALRRVERAHLLTCLARMPAEASVRTVDAALWSAGPATAFETWVHAACLVPAEDWPLLRLARAKVAGRERRPSEGVCAEVLAIVGDSDTGVTIDQIEEAGHRTTGWEWSERKRAAEYLLWRGDLICSERKNNRRVYDLPERRLPQAILRTELSRQMILATVAGRALGALGIATAHDIAVYCNLTAVEAAEGLALCAATTVTVEGWKATAWMPAQRRAPSQPLISEARLIGPFDNLIFDRVRARRVHDFDYTFEAYKPAHKRTYGHYVMGVLDPAGDLLGRADLRRQANSIEVIQAFPEAGVTDARFHAGLTTAVGVLAQQLQP